MSTLQSEYGLEPAKMPAHIAIVLDGNGRWAQQRGLGRSEGHRAGGETLDRLLDFFIKLKLPAISLYAFSTENWKRPQTEVKAIWSLMNEFFTERLHRCLENGIQIKASGNLDKIPSKSRTRIEDVIHQTRKGKNLIANFCVNYGSHDEILHAVDEIVQERLAHMKDGKKRKAQAPVKKKSSSSTSTLIPCLP